MARPSASYSRAPFLGGLALLAAAAFAASPLAQAPAPDVQVLDGTTVIPIGDSVAFGSTPPGVAVSKTVTVKNTGTANLLVSEAISVPQGFTLMQYFPGVPNAILGTAGQVNNVNPAYTIAPNDTATFVVALNSATPGSYSGLVSFNNNVTGKNPYSFTVSGTVTGSSPVRIIDDGDAGFTYTSGWFPNYPGDSGKVPYQGDLTWANPGTGTEVATWTFTGLTAGQYKVAATWAGFS